MKPIVILPLSLFSVTTSSAESLKQVRPNILFVISDYLGEHLSSDDDSFGNTPHLENLAEQETAFSNTRVLKNKSIDTNTKTIKVLILSNKDFDARKNIDVASLRFGTAEEVNFRSGCKVVKTENIGKGLLVEFDGVSNGITDENLVCKLLGKTNNGGFLIGYSKLSTK